ncbi:MAG: hypothetical protein RLN60_03430 [Phycisphaerales bacterium]
MKKSNPAESPIVLLDPVNSVYYYPKATTLSGEVIPGHPRVGVIAFEPIRAATSKLELHVHDVKLSRERGVKHSFSFRIVSPSLEKSTSTMQRSPDIRQMIDRIVNDAAQRAVDAVEKKRSGGGGCASAIVLAVIMVLAILVISAMMESGAN